MSLCLYCIYILYIYVYVYIFIYIYIYIYLYTVTHKLEIKDSHPNLVVVVLLIDPTCR